MILPATGLTTMVHMIIIGVKASWRPVGVMRNLLALFIILGVAGFTTISAAGALADAAGSGHLQYIASRLQECELIPATDSAYKVVLRIDDIQSDTGTDFQIRMIEDALSRDIPSLLGVIPKNLEKNKELYYYLKRNSCNLEIALHGWDHIRVDGEPEFKHLSAEDAYQRILKGKAVLEQVAGRPITTFIPPQNQYSSGIYRALELAEIPVLSSEGTKKFDYDAATYNFVQEDLVDNYEVLSVCKRRMREDNMCIIMVHPQDYMDATGVPNEDVYVNYLELLDHLRASDVQLTTVESIIK